MDTDGTKMNEIDEFLDYKQKKSFGNSCRFVLMALRPAGVLIFCLVLSIVVAVPCIAVIINVNADSVAYNFAFSIFTGVIASCLITLTIEMVGNYRRNYQRILVLHEYLGTISLYEEHVDWCKHGRMDTEVDWRSSEFTTRQKAVAELFLTVGSVIENAYMTGREYMSLKEMEQVVRVVETVSKTGDIAKDYINSHWDDSTMDACDGLDEEFKLRIEQFAYVEGGSCSNDFIQDVVADYILTCPDELPESTQRILKYTIDDFDQAMCSLKNIVKWEPVYHENLIPFDTRMEKMEKKMDKMSAKAAEETYKVLSKGVERGYITQGEMDEYYALDDMPEDSIQDMPEYDDDEIDKIIKERARKWPNADTKRLFKQLKIYEKAQGNSSDVPFAPGILP